MKCRRSPERDEWMGSKYRNTFFENKRDWSKYKDAVLNYYLTPYLQKVKKIGKPICIVDMFAGRGEFETGDQGSPLIIANHLQKLQQQGYRVKLRCYENYPPFYKHLVTILQPFSFAEALRKDCFSEVADIAQLSATHTTLLYIDPFDVVQLRLSKLGLIFDKVRGHSSVEALIVFMARAFMRQAALLRSVEIRFKELDASGDTLIRDAEEDDRAIWGGALRGQETEGQQAKSQKHQALLSDIAGGDYWQEIVQDSASPWEENCARLVDEYRQRLRAWFKLVEALPVHSDRSANPKYWIVFMSRYEPAFDLFNRAACEIIRTQRQNFQKEPGSLFAGVDLPPAIPTPQAVDRAVKRAAQPLSSCRWKELRWRICGNRNVGKFTDSETNQSIKRLLKTDWLNGASGDKVEEEAILSPTAQLRSWTDR
jgi:three-Cys-motif partner protein